MSLYNKITYTPLMLPTDDVDKKQSLGCQEEAEAAFIRHKGGEVKEYEVKRVSHGLFRRVYKIDQVVYKFVRFDNDAGSPYHWYSNGGDVLNKREHEIMVEYASESWTLDTGLYRVDNHYVICMTYIDVPMLDITNYYYRADSQPHKRTAESINTELREIGMQMREFWIKHNYTSRDGDRPGTDLHCNNWRILNDGTIKIIDAGGSF